MDAIWVTLTNLLVAVAGVTFLIVYFSRKINSAPTAVTVIELQQQLDELRRERDRVIAQMKDEHDRQMREMQDEHSRQMLEMQKRVNTSLDELKEAKEVIEDMRDKYERDQSSPKFPARPLLLIGGTEPRFFERDRGALRQAKVEFFELPNATPDRIRSEFQKRRFQGLAYPWVHVSAHMGPAGVLFVDEAGEAVVLGADWWQTMLQGVDTIFFAGCESLDIGEDVVGIAETVVVSTQSIPDDMAVNFTFSFWRQMMSYQSPDTAFNNAIREVLGSGSYVDSFSR